MGEEKRGTKNEDFKPSIRAVRVLETACSYPELRKPRSRKAREGSYEALSVAGGVDALGFPFAVFSSLRFKTRV
jgi:hypothetical protein